MAEREPRPRSPAQRRGRRRWRLRWLLLPGLDNTQTHALKSMCSNIHVNTTHSATQAYTQTHLKEQPPSPPTGVPELSFLIRHEGSGGEVRLSPPPPLPHGSAVRVDRPSTQTQIFFCTLSNTNAVLKCKCNSAFLLMEFE